MNDYKKYGEYSKESTQSDNLKVALTFLAIGAGIGALISLLVSPVPVVRSGSPSVGNSTMHVAVSTSKPHVCVAQLARHARK
jgi:hypothetical protein